MPPDSSPSPRRAWIEINFVRLSEAFSAVALPTEGVDRNKSRFQPGEWSPRVALPTEGVDRNFDTELTVDLTDVALPTEGVDRNRCRWA